MNLLELCFDQMVKSHRNMGMYFSKLGHQNRCLAQHEISEQGFTVSNIKYYYV